MMRRVIRCLYLPGLFFLCSCTVLFPDKLVLNQISYDQLPRWQEEQHEEIIQLFSQSCHLLKTTDIAGIPISEIVWTSRCQEAKELSTSVDARQWIEAHFTPYELTSSYKEKGLLTGYFIPEIRGSLVKTPLYNIPVYGLPKDMKEDEPYMARARIETGAIKDKADILLWVDDPVALFFLHIQGSGRVRLVDGSVRQLQYAGKNGQPYTSIGRILKEKEWIDPENVTMQSIKKWLYANPEQAKDIMWQNDSYVFFTLEQADSMPKGAAGFPLFPDRSVAVDNRLLPYGLPVYLDTRTVDDVALSRLFFALDTGGAIRGTLRGDIFFGAGERAAYLAGGQDAKGSWYVLLPEEK